MNKEPTIKKENAIATNIVFEADANVLTGTVGQDDLALPFLKILGQLSPEVNKRDGKYVEGAETDRRLPRAIRQQKLSAWPDVVNDWHGYGWTQIGETMLRPTSKQIDNYDRALELTVSMPEADRKLVWGVAHSAAFKARGAPWGRLARLLGMGTDGRVVKRNYMDALIRLHYRI